MSARILNAQGILSSDVPTGNLLWVDAVNGIDALAMRGRMTIPFKTLTAAKNAARSGNPSATPPIPNDTIIVLPGYYDEKNLLKNGVNWHILPGASVIYKGLQDGGPHDGGIFDTSSLGTNGPVASMITGWGVFRVEVSTTAGHVIHSAATGSDLLIHARKMYSYVAACVKTGANSGTLNIQVLEAIESSSGRVVEIGGGSPNIIRANRLNSSGGAGLYVSAGNVDLDAQYISSSSDSAISISGGSGSNIVVRAYEINSSSKPAVYYNASSNPVLTIIGARLVSQSETAADGRAVRIDSNSSDKIKLDDCILIASAAAADSVYAATNPTRVHFLHGVAQNKSLHANVTYIGVTLGITLYTNSAIS